MTSQDKYAECLKLLTEMHDVVYVIIESGMEENLTAFQLLEEALNTVYTMNNVSKINNPQVIAPEKKEKKILH